VMCSLLLSQSRGVTGEPRTPEAPATCATCHAGVVRSFATAPMHHAMEIDGANPELIAHPDLSTTIGPYTYRVQTRDGHSTYSVADGANTISVPIHWIFGQHTQTWILEKDGAFYETLVSYYPRDNTLATTPDDEKIKPKTLQEAMGRRLPVSEVRTCFDCHASGLVPAEKLVPSKTTPGVACERCHTGSQQHMVDALRDNFKTLPVSFKHLDAQQISDFCGQCHRRFDTVIRDRLHGNGTVRFQPYRLELSKCFIGDDPRISCISCHNPHHQLDHEIAHYDAKCFACHSATKTTATATTVKMCPVAKTNCTSCHMPKVEIAGNHAQFTDHYIRVVRPGESYPQ
jgi:Cytochrome c554 and c-prime